MSEKKEIIVGIHSIAAAFNNPNRSSFQLIGTKESIAEVRKLMPKDAKYDLLQKGSHQVQELAKNYYKEMDFQYTRVPSNIFLTSTRVEEKGMAWLYDEIEAGKANKIVALDQVTDVHNLAAILRTSSFYGMDAIIFSRKGGSNFPPSFFRISSGAAEYVPVINVASLPKTLNKLKEKRIALIGFSEHSEDSLLEAEAAQCLVLGAEETGLSHSIKRILDKCISLKSSGDIKSLNVSVAAAVAMEKIFGKK